MAHGEVAADVVPGPLNLQGDVVVGPVEVGDRDLDIARVIARVPARAVTPPLTRQAVSRRTASSMPRSTASPVSRPISE